MSRICSDWQQKSCAQAMPPNPSIEGTHKRLRLLRPPHVKRWASLEGP